MLYYVTLYCTIPMFKGQAIEHHRIVTLVTFLSSEECILSVYMYNVYCETSSACQARAVRLLAMSLNGFKRL